MPVLGALGRGSRLLALALLVVSSANSQPFNLDSGNAAIEVVIPAVAPVIFSDISPGGSDAPIVLRVTTLITNAWFDAIAPYHSTAVGVYSRLGRRPAAERLTNRNQNIALLYSTFRVVNSLLPARRNEWRQMLLSVGLNPDDAAENNTTPAGIGNAAGNAVVAARQRDGMNQLGDEDGRKYNLRPYADYTGYKPVNTPYELRDPSRWQPNFGPKLLGTWTSQVFVTPQYGLTRPYSYATPAPFITPVPSDSNPHGPHGRQRYRQQADEVLAASAALNDHRKLTAEHFDNKIFSLGFSAVFAALSRGLSLADFVHLDFLTNMAAFDAGIACWKEKYRHDAVRPFTAIEYLYGNHPITAWGGPGKGTVTDLPASNWTGYLNTADHPEYPSGSACFCSAHAQAARRFLNSDALNWTVPFARGSSRVEPGITPASDTVLTFNTWTEFETQCGLSRFWGGVHFLPSITAGHQLCKPIGDIAYEFLRAHIGGTAPNPK